MTTSTYKVLKKVKKIADVIKGFVQFPLIAGDYFHFKKLMNIDSSKRFRVSIFNIMPCPFEKTPFTRFDTHYVYHTAWAARVVSSLRVEKHIDISSSLYFSSIVSAFIPVDFYDYRPAQLNLSNLESKSADLLHLPFSDDSIASLSCMHTVEHVGLGRYGDPIDVDGDVKAVIELSRVVSKGGSLIFVVPIGSPRIQFNAHRVYSYKMVLEMFPLFTVKEFSLIPDNALTEGMIYNASETDSDRQNYGCGCFWLVKK